MGTKTIPGQVSIQCRGADSRLNVEEGSQKGSPAKKGHVSIESKRRLAPIIMSEAGTKGLRHLPRTGGKGWGGC